MAAIVESLIKRSWPALKPHVIECGMTALTTILDLLAADFPQFAPVLTEAKNALALIVKL